MNTKSRRFRAAFCLALITLSAQAAHAACTEEYRVRIVELGEHQVVGTTLGIPGGIIAGPLGGLASGALSIGAFGVVNKYVVRMWERRGQAIVGAVAAAGIVAYLAKEYFEKRDAKKVLALLKDAEAGHGFALSDVQATLDARKTGSDLPSVIRRLRSANEEDTFCPASGKLYKFKDVVAWLKSPEDSQVSDGFVKGPVDLAAVSDRSKETSFSGPGATPAE